MVRLLVRIFGAFVDPILISILRDIYFGNNACMIRLLYAKFRYLLSVKLSRIQASLMSLVDHKFKQSHFKTVFKPVF